MPPFAGATIRGMRLPALLAVLACAAQFGFAAGFLEGGGVEQSVRHPGPVRRVVVEGRYLDVDVGGGETAGVAARAVVSRKLHRRNGFELQIAMDGGRASIGFALNDRPISGYSITWGPRLTVGVPRNAEVYVRTTTGDVLVTGLGGPDGAAAVFVESAAGMVVVQDSAADVRLVSGAGDLVVRRVAGDLHLAADAGDIVVQDSRGDVRARTAVGRQRFADVDGTITVSSRDGVTVSGAIGSLRVGAAGVPSLPEWGAETPWRRR